MLLAFVSLVQINSILRNCVALGIVFTGLLCCNICIVQPKLSFTIHCRVSMEYSLVVSVHMCSVVFYPILSHHLSFLQKLPVEMER